MTLKPDVSLPWYAQILDLEARGKPTTVAAHEMAAAAKARADARNWMQEPELAGPPPLQFDDLQELPF